MASNTFFAVRPTIHPLRKVNTSLTSVKSLCVYLPTLNFIIVSGELFSPEQTEFVLLLMFMNTGKQVRVISAHADLITQIKFHESANLLFTGSLDNHLRLWNHQLKCLDDIELDGPIWAIEIIPDQNNVVIGGEFDGLKVFELTGSESKNKSVISQTKDVRTPNSRYCASIKYIKPHNCLAMGCREAEEVLVYDWSNKTIKYRLRREYCYEIVDYLEYFEHADTLFCGGSNMDSLYWKFSQTRGKAPQMCVFEEAMSNVSSVLMNKYDQTFYICQYNKFLNVMNIKNGNLKKRHFLFDKRGDTLVNIDKQDILIVTESKNVKVHFFSLIKGT